MSKPDVKRFRKLLDEKAAELALSIRPHELEGAADQARAGPAEAMQEQAMAMAIEQRRERELVRVQAAIERIDAGEYGDCVRCGERIQDQRLESDPAAPLCIDCASAA